MFFSLYSFNSESAHQLLFLFSGTVTALLVYPPSVPPACFPYSFLLRNCSMMFWEERREQRRTDLCLRWQPLSILWGDSKGEEPLCHCAVDWGELSLLCKMFFFLKSNICLDSSFPLFSLGPSAASPFPSHPLVINFSHARRSLPYHWRM